MALFASGQTEEEVVAVLAEVPEKHRLLVEFLAQTGLRISEALALTKEDIDFGRRPVSVSRRLYAGRLMLATEPDDAVVFVADRSKPYAAVRAAGERGGDRVAGRVAHIPALMRIDHVPSQCAQGGDPSAARASLV